MINNKTKKQNRKYNPNKKIHKHKATYKTVKNKPFGFATTKPGHPDAYVHPKHTKGLINGDTVNITYTKSGGTQPKADVQTLKLEKRNSHIILATHTNNNNKTVFTIEPDYAHKLTIETTKQKLPQNSLAVIKISGTTKPKFEKTVDIIKNGNIKHYLQARALCHHQNYEQPETFETPKDSAPTRTNYNNLTTFTIDSDTSKDLDDAISCEKTADGYKMYVHIADASELLKNKNILKVMRNSYTTLYLNEHTRPMYPVHLSETKYSLTPGNEKLAMTISYDIQNGKISNTKIEETTVRSDQRLNYLNVSKWITTGVNTGNEKLNTSLQNTIEAAAQLQKERNKRQTVEFNRNETTEKDETGRKLVETIMVATNEQAAAWCKQQGAVVPYRTHSYHDKTNRNYIAVEKEMKHYNVTLKPPKTPSDLLHIHNQLSEKTPNKKTADMIVRKLMAPAKYERTPNTHAGLASKCYLHWTSPLRRGADDYVHIAAKYIIRNKPQNFPWKLLTKLEMDKELENLNEKMKNAATAENMERRSLKILENKHLKGSVTEGQINIVTNKGAIVETETLHVKLKPTNNDENLRIGQTVKLKITELKITEGQANGILLNN